MLRKIYEKLAQWFLGNRITGGFSVLHFSYLYFLTFYNRQAFTFMISFMLKGYLKTEIKSCSEGFYVVTKRQDDGRVVRGGKDLCKGNEQMGLRPLSRGLCFSGSQAPPAWRALVCSWAGASWSFPSHAEPPTLFRWSSCTRPAPKKEASPAAGHGVGSSWAGTQSRPPFFLRSYSSWLIPHPQWFKDEIS